MIPGHTLKELWPYSIFMTPIQIRVEIDKLLNELPDEALQSVLDLLNEIKSQPAEKVWLAANIKKIITEERELLKRLAQ
jgi:hypothetical protein